MIRSGITNPRFDNVQVETQSFVQHYMAPSYYLVSGTPFGFASDRNWIESRLESA